MPGVTDTEENLDAVIDFLSSCGAKQVSPLPYNPMGLAKFETLGRPTPDLPEKFMKHQEESHAYEILNRRPLS